MKTNRSLIKGLVASGMAMAVVSSLVAQTPIQHAATVVRIVGHARYKAAGMEWQTLRVGDLIKPGTIIQTSKEPDGKAYVDLSLEGGAAPDVRTGPKPMDAAPAAFSATHPPSLLGYHASAGQNVVRIFDNTALGVDKLSAMDTGAGTVTDTELDLKTGHIFVNVKKMTAGSRYEVKMPNGVAGIRGSAVHFFAEGVIWTGPNTRVTAAYMDSNNQAVTTDMTDDSALDMRTGALSTLPPTDISFIDALIRDTSYFAGVTQLLSYSPDFTCNHPMSFNNLGP